MRYHILTLLMALVIVLGSCNNKKVENKALDNTDVAPNSEPTKKSSVYGHEVMDSKEFQNYFDIFFKQSDSKTGKTLIHVNKYISDNNIVISEGACKLLENDKIKSDSITFKYFDNRCKFLKARKELLNKFNIDGDSINKLMRKAIEIKSLR